MLSAAVSVTVPALMFEMALSGSRMSPEVVVSEKFRLVPPFWTSLIVVSVPSSEILIVVVPDRL